MIRRAVVHLTPKPTMPRMLFSDGSGDSLRLTDVLLQKSEMAHDSKQGCRRLQCHYRHVNMHGRMQNNDDACGDGMRDGRRRTSLGEKRTVTRDI